MSKSILQTDDSICYICLKPIYNGKHCHHIYGGTRNRSKSEEDGMKVYCHECCHRFLHQHPMTDQNFKRRGQKIWMKHYGKTVKDFIKRYGRNYLDDETEVIEEYDTEG